LNVTIYWERCGVCGGYSPVKQCTLYQDLLVDAKCCISCVKRSVCPRPVWRFEAVLGKGPVKTASPDEKRKLLMELLERFNEEKK